MAKSRSPSRRALPPLKDVATSLQSPGPERAVRLAMVIALDPPQAMQRHRPYGGVGPRHTRAFPRPWERD